MSKEFVWTDQMVVEFTSWSLTKSPTFQGRYADIEQFKASHQPKEEGAITPIDIDQFGKDKERFDKLYNTLKEDKPDWEIVSMKYLDRVIRYSKETFFPNVWDIHSVKRISDGEVFSVGDEVDTLIPQKIEYIKVKGSICVVGGKNFGSPLDKTQKSKPKEEIKEDKMTKHEWDVPGWGKGQIFIPKEEVKEPKKIEVGDIEEYEEMYPNGGYYMFECASGIPPEKLTLIKQAIEKIINNEA